MSDVEIIYGKISKIEDKKIHVCLKDFLRPFTDNESISLGITELNKISNKIRANPRFFEALLYENTLLWWLIYNPISKQFIEIITFLENFLNFIEQKKPAKILVKNDFENFEIIREICALYKIELTYSNFSLIRNKVLRQIRDKIKKFVGTMILKIKLKKRYKKFLKTKKNIPNFNNKIIFGSYSTYRRNIFDFKECTTKNEEFIFYEINKLIQSKKNVGIDLFSQIKSNDKILEQRLNSKLDWVPFEFFLFNNNNSICSKIFLKNYDELLNSISFQKIFTFREINYWSKIKPLLNKMKNDFYLPLWMSWIDSVKFTFKKELPKAVFLLYETSPMSLGLISVCKELGIKTFGVQHGIIHEYHPYYMHNNFTKTDPSNFILPDKLLLFGDIPYEILIKKGYPEEKLECFGNPIFFGYKPISEDIKKELKRKLKLENFKHIILFAPPKLPDTKTELNSNLKIVHQLISDFNHQDNYLVLIKLHPLDSTAKFQKLLHDSTAIKLIEGSIIELILISDLVISTYSTTILDALALQKPVIQIKMENENFAMPFDNFECVLPSSITELKSNIEKFFTDKEYKRRIQKNGDQFIKKYYNLPISNLDEKINSLLEQ